MKKRYGIIAAMMITLGISTVSCGGGNSLMEGASVKNSALCMYYYDGEDTVCGYLYDPVEIQKLLDSLAAVKVVPIPDWSAKDLSAPFFGIQIMKDDGRPLAAVWSASMWITQEGEAYRFPYSVAKLWGDYPWQTMTAWPGAMVLPAQRALAYCDGNGDVSQEDGRSSFWDPTWMTPAQDLVAHEGHSAELVEWNETSVTVKLTNHSGQDWTFGEYYHLEVYLDGDWYHVPTAPGENWAVHDLAYILPDRGEMEMTYSLVCYGDLPEGHYRLVAEAFDEGLAVEAEATTANGQQ